MSALVNIKEELYQFCSDYIDKRLVRIQKEIRGIQDSMKSETKSSAGDKHETGRAMLQLEREKLGQQLLEAEKTRQILNQVDVNQNSAIIGLGSLVHTSTNSYFIAISSGQYKMGNNTIYCISAGTPIGRELIGKSSGNRLIFKNNTTIIEEVL
ncbi:3-oxoacyl-ACP synthase [Muriicola sp. Z0-33]|uniref:3-oxoacyl-ACP synthase n=1 Tax=Muriicola sp. Z0-33 TaxID=2816957 RepID=UPI0022383063|nr:3-oxoacyl-ACP synthase [Muriicola sp. Z0-33]MCW5514787.1 3-oxoacyl-ACP synthase [Muriicola sp. Z0-33]